MREPQQLIIIVAYILRFSSYIVICMRSPQPNTELIFSTFKCDNTDDTTQWSQLHRVLVGESWLVVVGGGTRKGTVSRAFERRDSTATKSNKVVTLDLTELTIPRTYIVPHSFVNTLI